MQTTKNTNTTRRRIIGEALRDYPDFFPPCFVQAEQVFDVRQGEKIGPYVLPAGQHTAREIAKAIPGAYVREHEPNAIVLPRSDGGTYAIEVAKMLDVIRGERS